MFVKQKTIGQDPLLRMLIQLNWYYQSANNVILLEMECLRRINC